MLLRVKELRIARQMTIEQLASLAGMSKSYLSEIENGKKQINGRRLEAIARVLGVTAADLISDSSISSDLSAHLDVIRHLPPEDRAAVLRHAMSLLRAREQ